METFHSDGRLIQWMVTLWSFVTLLLNMTIEIVDFDLPIENGGSFHGYVNVDQRVDGGIVMENQWWICTLYTKWCFKFRRFKGTGTLKKFSRNFTSNKNLMDLDLTCWISKIMKRIANVTIRSSTRNPSRKRARFFPLMKSILPRRAVLYLKVCDYDKPVEVNVKKIVDSLVTSHDRKPQKLKYVVTKLPQPQLTVQVCFGSG